MSLPILPKFKKVMLIDDNRIDLYIASRIITKNYFGETVLPYSNAVDALDYLIEHQKQLSMLPEIIFLDIYMPVMSGLEFMKEYAKLDPGLKNHCKVFIISSSLNEKDKESADNDINIVSMQQKPINKDFLNELVLGAAFNPLYIKSK